MKCFYYDEFGLKKEIIAEDIEVKDGQTVIIIVTQNEACKIVMKEGLPVAAVCSRIWRGFNGELYKLEPPLMLATFI